NRSDHHQTGRHRTGGVIAAIAGERPIPVCFLGVGEGPEDLDIFSADAYVDALIE
ncbi:Signal recognition particle, SRP54 subunit, GTPase domain protein, partial [mine drainage metagenome]